MTNLLVKIFIKDSDRVNDPIVRKCYGTLSSVVGIICNILLFIAKYIIGTLSNSISIVSDAFNNLSDCAGCLVTLLGYKMASKPADRDHPFGHGRIEYLTALFLSVIIMFVGAELLRGSAAKIIDPEEIKFSIAAVSGLILSIGVKLWMSLFNGKLGKRINSSVLNATAKDSRNDVLATSAALIALVASLFTDLPMDGIMGILVSAFIIKTGFDITKETVDELLGKPADKEVVKKIKFFVLENDRILGIHDLVIHNYGPGNLIGSCHVEVDHRESLMEIHDVIDGIERRIESDMGIRMTIHTDPVESDCQLRSELKELTAKVLCEIAEKLSFHDFRVVQSDSHTNLIFDLEVPYKCKYSNDVLKQMIDGKLKSIDRRFYTVIIFDNEFEE